MKIIADMGGTTYTLLITPNMLLLVAAIIVLLIVAKWHYAQKRRELDFKQWEKIHNDYRTGEANRSIKFLYDSHSQLSFNVQYMAELFSIC